MKFSKKAALAASLMATISATPASAAIYDYTMTNGDLLSINTDTATATFTGKKIKTSMTSSSFATFTGGATPTFSFILDSLDGTRLIKSKWITDNPKNSTTTHPQKLIIDGKGNVNLWAWWGTPIIGGDYLTKVKSYSAQVPEPGALGLMAIGLGGLGGLTFARRRRKKLALAAA